nr:hypothetical protein [Tanacetum cinerariifolium]
RPAAILRGRCRSAASGPGLRGASHRPSALPAPTPRSGRFADKALH